MAAIESILSLIVTLGILVTIHEFGHYWVARRCGVKVLRFSVGFGKPVYSRTSKDGVEFCVAAIPLGGYVRMLDEREGDVSEEEKPFAFNRKPPMQRIAIASAGPLANFIFAIFAYWLMFVAGFNVVRPVVGEVEQGSIAYQSGLQSGDEFVEVAGRSVAGWREVSIAFANYVGESDLVPVFVRSQAGEPKQLTLELNEWNKNVEDLDLLGSLGIEIYRPHVPAVIENILADGAAATGGMQVGDEIIAVDGQEISDWFSLVAIIQASAEKTLNISVERKRDNGTSDELVLVITPAIRTSEGGEQQGFLGVGPAPFKYPDEMIKTVHYGPFSALAESAEQTYADTAMTLNAMRKMLIGLLSLENLSGPITIAQVASQTISSGLEDFLSFLALLSISLGVLNLLPVPVLDGGHILYYTLELIRGKPLPESVQVLGLKIGISLVAALMVIAFYNDIVRVLATL